MSDNVVNGKYYPMWQQIVDKKKDWIGGKIFNFDMGMKAEGTIKDILLRPNGDDSAMVIVTTEDNYGGEDEWGWDVQYAGIAANDTDEPGLAISAMYSGTFVMQKPSESQTNNGDTHE